MATPAVPHDSRLVETHTAFVLLLHDRVLKWKKPVDLGFLDFRTREAREAACQAEVVLNRRLAPDVYLGVDTLVDGGGEPVEHVVVMRRLPDDARLSTLIEQGRDVTSDVARLAKLLATFHSRCPAVPDPEAIAGRRRLLELWHTTLAALQDLAPLGVDPSDLNRAESLVARWFAGRDALLQDRMRRGAIRDGHGDLLADDIFCLPDGPRVLDCLDFDETLRQGDVLNDLAMLVMDLERLGAPDLGRLLVERYVELTGERHPSSLLHLYVAYRAVVRAKVALLRGAQLPLSEGSAQAAEARALVDLALHHLGRAQPRLVLVGGLPGTGKSAVAEALSTRRGWLVHSSDLVRGELLIPRLRRYARPWRTAVYGVLLDRARAELTQGWDVVLDATWSQAAFRDQARAVAVDTSSVLVELNCSSPAVVAERRLVARPVGHPSEAGPEVRRVLEASSDPWPTATIVDTSGPVEEALATAERVALADSWEDLPPERSPMSAGGSDR